MEEIFPDRREEPPEAPPAPEPPEVPHRRGSDVERPSFAAVLRGVLFAALAGGAAAFCGHGWAGAYARYRAFRGVDVSPLLAAAPAVPADEGQAKQPRDVLFRLEAPQARTVLLGGTFNSFDARRSPMVRGRDGAWEATLPLLPGRYLYKFKVDGQWALDPANPDHTPAPGEASVLNIQ